MMMMMTMMMIDNDGYVMIMVINFMHSLTKVHLTTYKYSERTNPCLYRTVFTFQELHDRDDPFPMAPENRTVTTEMLSDHTKMLADQCGITLKDEKKLCQTLLPKERYVIHYLTLKYYLSKGMILTNIHEVIEFSQCTWLQDFIQYTCDKRKESDNEFDKLIHKSVACNVFGKIYLYKYIYSFPLSTIINASFFYPFFVN